MKTLESIQNGAGADVWGIDVDLRVSVGYDSGADAAEINRPNWVDDDFSMLSIAERVRLADMMIDRWSRYRAAVLALPEPAAVTSAPKATA